MFFSTVCFGLCLTHVLVGASQALLDTYSCRKVSNQSFCNTVDYVAACSSEDPLRSCNDTYAASIFKSFQTALQVFSCNDYSRLYTCANCTEAYKRWLCGVLFRKCVDQNATVDSCRGFVRPDTEGQPACVMKTCQDMCYDVVRKCPVQLGFQCPPTDDVREYGPAGLPCNNLDRPWPSSSVSVRASAALVLLSSLLVGLVIL